MISSSSAASAGGRERRAVRGAALAALVALVAGAAFADGGEPPPDEGVAAPTPRAIESRWRRPPGCAPEPTFTIRADGARVLAARSASPACRVQGDADAQVRAWLGSLPIEVDTLGTRDAGGSRPQPGR